MIRKRTIPIFCIAALLAPVQAQAEAVDLDLGIITITIGSDDEDSDEGLALPEDGAAVPWEEDAAAGAQPYDPSGAPHYGYGSGDGRITGTFPEDQPPPPTDYAAIQQSDLAGTQWRFERLRAGDVQGQEYRIHFEPDGRFTLSMPCNYGVGRWQPHRLASEDRGRLLIDSISLTRNVCGTIGNENQIVRDLLEIKRFRINGDQMSFRIADQSGSYRLVSTSAQSAAVQPRPRPPIRPRRPSEDSAGSEQGRTRCSTRVERRNGERVRVRDCRDQSAGDQAQCRTIVRTDRRTGETSRVRDCRDQSASTQQCRNVWRADPRTGIQRRTRVCRSEGSRRPLTASNRRR